jgi:integrase
VIKRHESPLTQERYNAALDRWLAFCDNHRFEPVDPPVAITAMFRAHLLKDLASGSTRTVLAGLSSIYKDLMRLEGGGVKFNPFHSAVLSWPKAPAKGKTPAVAHFEAEAIIATCKDGTREGLRDEALLRLYYDIGGRRTAIVKSLRRDLQEDPDSGMFLRFIVKGGREEASSLPEATIEALKTWLRIAPPSKFVFPELGHKPNRGDRSLNPYSVNRMIRKRAKQAGIARQIHPHMFRARFATDAYDSGMPEYEIQAAMHHRDPATTRSYDRNSRGLGVPNAVAALRAAKQRSSR